MLERAFQNGLVYLLLICMAGGSSCSRDNSSSNDTSSRNAAAKSAEIRILYPGSGALLSPLWNVSAQHLVFLPLFELDEQGRVQGKLAESWEHSDDFRTWTYHIRPDVRWHDGVPVTAHDIVFSIRLRQEAYGLSPEIEAVAHDDTTVTVRYPEPTEGRSWWTVYWPRHILESLDPEEFGSWEFWYEPIGNGPYRFVRRVPETLIELEANPDYFRGPPQVERVILRLGGGTPLTELRSGNVDAAAHVDRAQAVRLVQDPRYRLEWAYSGWDVAVHWNLRHPVLSDARVRRALIMGLDRDEILALLDLPSELTVPDTIRPDPLQHPIDTPPRYPYDPYAARRLLTDAGWEDTDGDFIRERDGSELVLPLQVPGTGGLARSSFQAIAVLAQDSWREIGVGVEIDIGDRGQVVRAMQRGEFEAMAINRFLHGERHHLRYFGADSVIGYDNPEVQQLLHRIHEEAPLSEWPRLYGDLMPEFQADAPILFLLPETSTHVIESRFRGLSTPWRADPVGYAEFLSLRGMGS